MKDLKRIKKVLKIVGKVWEQYPDLRLGQLLLNVVGPHSDLYYVSDDDLMRLTVHYYIELTRKEQCCGSSGNCCKEKKEDATKARKAKKKASRP